MQTTKRHHQVKIAEKDEAVAGRLQDANRWFCYDCRKECFVNVKKQIRE